MKMQSAFIKEKDSLNENELTTTISVWSIKQPFTWCTKCKETKMLCIFELVNTLS